MMAPSGSFSVNWHKTLTSAGRCRHSRRWHLFGSCTAGGSLGQARRGDSEALAARDDEIIDWLALLDLSVQCEPRMTRFVHTGLLLSICHAGRQRPKSDRRASRGRLLGWRLSRRFGGREDKAESQANTYRERAPHCQFLMSGSDCL
jgi:hypothetical protein